MTTFNITRDVSGAVTYGIPFSGNSYSCALTQNSNTSLTVPYINPMGNINLNNTTKQNIAAVFTFTPGDEVWVADNATAAAPAGSSFASTASELNPAVRYVNGGDVLNFYTTATGVAVSVCFYSLD